MYLYMYTYAYMYAGLTTFFTKPMLPSYIKTRLELGMFADENIYVCPQVPCKVSSALSVSVSVSVLGGEV